MKFLGSWEHNRQETFLLTTVMCRPIKNWDLNGFNLQSDNKLPSLGKVCEHETLDPESFSRDNGKFIIHDKASDYFTFRQSYVQLNGNGDLLLVSHVKGIINVNEFAILFNVNMSGNPLFPHENYAEFSLGNFSRGECIVEFRVKKNDLRVLADALGTPPVFRCLQRFVFEGMEGLCMLLK